ncbi:MAG TPA: metalloregulator ArsR/SmtB family transcription factor [Candidatus Binataceae bacterium]|jgi:DNA-binding transcriptional ArsR family regulator|nr:metalloregulator ArsR/SmtB family transcription factor [Candidatus Binataceae bacterium]
MSRTRSSASAKFAQAAPIFAALGDETRLRVVARLCGAGPLPIARLADGAGVSRQAITKHLHALEGAGLAYSSRVGREQLWELRTKQLSEAREYLDQISQQWDAALDRLRAMVETET